MVSWLFTCVHVGLAEEQWQTLYIVKRVKVMDALMKAVHAVLMLETQDTHSSALNKR